MKQRLSLAVGLARVFAKLLTKILHLSTQAFDLSITYLVAIGTKPNSPCSTFSGGDGFGDSSKLIFMLIDG